MSMNFRPLIKVFGCAAPPITASLADKSNFRPAKLQAYARSACFRHCGVPEARRSPQWARELMCQLQPPKRKVVIDRAFIEALCYCQA